MPNFVGSVDVDIYFGTKYDNINVPYATTQIVRDATRAMHRQGQVVWQTTWLSNIRINVDDYQDIVGAQYVRLTDTGTTNHGEHWYTVVGYQQLSRGTVDIGLQYDPLLTLGINNISEISGTLKRWTVDTDGTFDWVLTPEPINQAQPYQMGIKTLNPITSASEMINIVGTNVDLSDPPEILTYTNPGGDTTSIYYPKMEQATPTTFQHNVNGVTNSYTDGMAYYLWNSTTVRENYSAATGLAYDLSTVAYKLPVSATISLTLGDNGKITRITGGTSSYNNSSAGGISRYQTGYNNAKAGSIGTYFELYNAATGDSVTVQNYMLDALHVVVYADPSYSGRFYAKFSSYLNSSGGYSGLVRSAGWQPLTVSSSTGYGSTLSKVNNDFALRQVNTTQQIQSNQLMADMYTGTVNTLRNTLPAVGRADTASGAIRAGLGGLVDYSTQMAQWVVQADAINQQATLQREMLSVQGNITTNQPPAVKYAGDGDMYSTTGYAFQLRGYSLTDADRKRADRFFTAYGYNVDNYKLSSPAQLKCRQRFVFVQSDDVVFGAGTPVNRTRTHDFQTVQAIRDRFACGLRIWQTTPDYDWDKANPINS